MSADAAAERAGFATVFAVITERPGASPRTTPVGDTAATLGSELVQIH